MELILPAPKDAPSAARLCRCAEKAATMKAEGYTTEENPWIEDCLMVHKPLDEYGVYVGGYAVCLQTKTCTCPDFQKHCDYCKHLLFVAEELREENRRMWEAICAQVEAEAEEAECAMGCDPHYRFDVA